MSEILKSTMHVNDLQSQIYNRRQIFVTGTLPKKEVNELFKI